MTDNTNFEQSVKDRLKQKRLELGIDYNILIKKYFIDEFLIRLSKTKYREKFVWKGGFVLSAISGIEKRTTVDLDTMLNGVDVNTKTLTKMIKEIIDILPENNIKYSLLDIAPIQEDKDYSGLRVKIKAQLGNMIDKFHLDVATGEELNPSEIEWSYRPILSKEPVSILIYRPERILAEKLQTVLDRGVLNTRMKDFYDIYTIPKFVNINNETLSLAFKVVMTERNSLKQWDRRERLISMIRADEEMKAMWENYKKNHTFVGNIDFKDTLDSVTNLLKEIQY